MKIEFLGGPMGDVYRRPLTNKAGKVVGKLHIEKGQIAEVPDGVAREIMETHPACFEISKRKTVDVTVTVPETDPEPEPETDPEGE